MPGPPPPRLNSRHQSPPSAAELLKQLEQCLASDRYRLRGRLRRLARQRGQRVPDDMAAAIAASRTARQARQEQLPRPEYPAELPISQQRERILELIRRHQVVILCGETGSGKSTQLPKLCLEAGRGVDGYIGHTQPRRLAARAVAVRITEELGGAPGQLAGYKVRFHDQVADTAYIKVMTDGILLAEIPSDPFLTRYDTLIIDEAHERNLNVDFLLGYLKRLLPRRSDLKLIITSATIDPQRFAKFFDGAPVLEVSGRSYPVEMRYRPRSDNGEQQELQPAIRAAVDELTRAGPGDILVFLSGEREIRETHESLRRHQPPGTEILPLYARLSGAEQDRVFRPHAGRRIVLATNVAETSITVPGIRYVVDPGYARVKRYGTGARVQRLPVEPVSRSSANQRAGRCGRVAAGICIRLYSEADFLERPLYTDPEILRSSLAGVILRMEALRLGHVQEFPFIDPPSDRAVNDGYRLLQELGAVDENRHLTKTGHRLARLPVDPAIGRMLLAAIPEQCVSEVLVIAAALSIQDPRERPLDRREQADTAHRLFVGEKSDFLGFLKLWNAYHEQRRQLSGNRLRGWCREHFISYVRTREWQDIHHQLLQLMKEIGAQRSRAPADPAAIHRALLCGLIGNVAQKTEDGEYRGARGRSLHIFPGSSLRKTQPAWIMAAELVQTSRLFASGVAAIDPEWIEQVAPQLVKRAWLEPHWEKKRAQVVAYEQVSLYGLIVIPRRPVHFGPIDPTVARDIFLRSALVAGDYDSEAEFFVHNRELVREVEELEHKSRRRDVLVDEELLYRFYDERVPEGIFNGAGFEAWRKQVEQKDPRHLFLTRDHLMQHDAAAVTAVQYPDFLEVGGARFPLRYRFEPGDPEDGVTVTVPLAALNQLEPQHIDRLVPALTRDRIVALLRSLPKSLRRHFVPAPDFADACLDAAATPGPQLVRVLSQRLRQMTGVPVPEDAWDESRVPPHLRMHLVVTGANGNVLAAGRDLAQLKADLGARAEQSFRHGAVQEIERHGITAWDFGDLPERCVVAQQGAQLPGYPALVAEGDSVAIRVFDTRAGADTAMRTGLRRLLQLALPQQVKYLNKNLPGLKQACLHYAPIGHCDALAQELVNAAFDRAFLEHEQLPRDAAGFNSMLEQNKGTLTATAAELWKHVGRSLEAYHQAMLALAAAPAEATEQEREHIRHLVYPGFIAATPAASLRRLPVYLKAVVLRLQRYAQDPARDRERAAEIGPLWEQWRERDERNHRDGIHDAELDHYHWMLEEFRVSLFAQELRTAFPVSAKRLQKQWQTLNK